MRRGFLVGGADAWLAGLREAAGAEFERGPAAEPRAGDVVVLDAATPAGVEAMPLGNAFSTCRALKRDAQVVVFVVVRAHDPFGAEIARYCMADGVLTLREDGALDGLERVSARFTPRRGRAPIDSLLERLEGDLAEQDQRVSSGLQRILTESESAGAIARWTDPDTGLFDGLFAGFKLDEEFKRALRFHQPLSLLLLDAGVDTWPQDPGDRRTVLAEIASIFLTECRDIDVLARFTDRVFLFLFPGTGPDGAEVAARRVVDALRERVFSVPIAVRPAAGIATVPHPAIRDRRAFLGCAEAALERARTGEGPDAVRSADG